ncbi:MAG: zinc ABC transporter substrate-binding protein [Tetrasphaera sp.]|nr:zinc ABC transporter substrate-binding protein [Tetrasphaera sp.]
MLLRRSAVAVVTAAALLALGGCSGAPSQTPGAGRLDVVAAFYPLAYAVERVGGEHVTVASLTKPGAEPHDVELTPKDLASLTSARLVVYLTGFQPAVDDAVAATAQTPSLDVSTAAALTAAAGEPGGAKDPHFWLDPQRYREVVSAVADRLAELDAAHAAAYRANAAAFGTELTALDAEFTAGLRTCESRDLVTSHAAFGYLTERYDFTQRSIAGLSPDAEPDAASMTSIVAAVRAQGVRTIYSETLVDPALAETIARETGASVAVLDPIEGVTDRSAGRTYLEIMRSNLRTLVAGQRCS